MSADFALPRSRRLLAGLAASLLLHAAGYALLRAHRTTHAAPVSAASRISWLRILPAPVAPHVPVATPPRASRPRVAAIHRRAVAPAVAAARPASAPVTGVALAALALPMPARQAGWLRATALAQAPAAAPPLPPPERLQEARRAQLRQFLQQRLASLPLDAGPPGRCGPGDDDTPDAAQLQCDNDELQQRLREAAPALAALIKAYRRADPQVARVEVAFDGSRYRLEAR